MRKSVVHIFIDSAGAVSLAIGLSLLLANLSAHALIQPRDPILMIEMDTLFWVVGPLMVGLGVVCLFGRSTPLKLGILLWAGTNLLAYQAAFFWQMHRWNMSAYLASAAGAFGVSAIFGDWLFKTMGVYLLVGSAACLVGVWHESKTTLKIACANCGQHIRYAVKNLGHTIRCPRCQAVVILRTTKLLKISCFFCKEHIEFPAHALGRKIPCPHCKKDITLKEPV